MNEIIYLAALAIVMQAGVANLYGLAVGMNPVFVFIVTLFFNFLPVPIIIFVLEVFGRIEVVKKFRKYISKKLEKRKKFIEKHGKYAAILLSMVISPYGVALLLFILGVKRGIYTITFLSILFSSMIFMLGGLGIITLL